MHANSRQEIEQIAAGDIIFTISLKDTTTGDSLTDEKAKKLFLRVNRSSKDSYQLMAGLQTKLTKIRWVSVFKNLLKKINIPVLK